MANEYSRSVRGLVRGAVVLMVARVAMMAMGLLQTILIARWFGASVMVDVFFVAIAVPVMFLGVVETNLSLAFTPLFVELEESGKSDDAWVLAATLLKKGTLLVGLYMVATIVLAAPLASILAPGFTPEAKQELAFMIRCISPLALSMFVSATLVSLCFVRGAFALPGATYLVSSACPLMALYFLNRVIGIYALPIGLVVGSVLGVVMLFPQFGLGHPVFRTPTDIRHPAVRRFGKLIALRTAATSLMQVNVAVDGAFASTVAPGHVAHLAYASRVLMAMRRILVVPLGRSLMPALSRAAARGDLQSVRSMVIASTQLLGFFIIPVFAFLIGFSEEVVRMVLGSGAFSEAAVRYTAVALMLYGLGALSAVLNPILTATHFALRDSVSPLKISIVGAVLNVLMNIICLRILATGGIALATSLVMTAASVMLWRSLGKLSGRLDLRAVGLAFARALAGSLALVAVARVVYAQVSLDGLHPVFRILVAFMSGGLAYLTVQLVLGRGQLRQLRSVIRQGKASTGTGVPPSAE